MTGPEETDGTVVLPERVDIVAATRLRATVLAAEGDLAVDAGAVTVLTTPALQVLMAARDHQRAKNCALRLAPVSSGFTAAIETLGVPLDRLTTEGGDG